jgi:predicted house-cleaning NTP pyrophosphatase (Maf/HAM1 superfamily)
MARVTFRKIDPREALKIGKKHLDKAGSYAYQDDSDKLVVKVSGDWQTVVGLPLRVLKRLLEKSRNYSDT